jgi:hypothetical protein
MSSRKRSGALLFLLALAPIVFIGFVIDRYGVNVPYADEWSNLILVVKWDAERLTFGDLMRPHNADYFSVGPTAKVSARRNQRSFARLRMTR